MNGDTARSTDEEKKEREREAMAHEPFVAVVKSGGAESREGLSQAPGWTKRDGHVLPTTTTMRAAHIVFSSHMPSASLLPLYASYFVSSLLVNIVATCVPLSNRDTFPKVVD